MSNTAILYDFLKPSRKSFIGKKSDAEPGGADVEKIWSQGPGNKGLEVGFGRAGAGKAQISGAGTQCSFA